MHALFQNEMIYMAQPPLYEIKIKGRKESEYILSENQMRKRMIARGLEGTELVIRNGGAENKEAADDESKDADNNIGSRIEGEEMDSLAKTLVDAERTIGVLKQRGIDFAEFVSAYHDPSRGGLPAFRIYVEGQEEIYYDREQYEKRADELKEQAQNLAEGEEEEAVVAEELHEVGRLNKIGKQLEEQFGLDMKDFLLKPAKTVSGEALPTKFLLINGEENYEIASLADVCPGIRKIGGRGIEIKRFKGLGEMNAEQLWETTMNPATRTLLSVKLEDAGEADRLFSILMGGDVEKRRNFIRDHALEVQNLDV
jgi:DNA gyrase subunit B